MESLDNNSGNTNIYLARHGQTMWNVEHRIQGMRDSPLTQTGVKQATLLAKRLSSISLDVIYSSSSQRALNTAQIINEEQGEPRQIIQEDDLREISLGEWEGMKKSEIYRLYPASQNLYFSNPSEFRPVGDGESFHDVKKRVLTILAHIIQNNSGRNILIVTHTAIVKIIMSYFDGRPLERLWDPPRVRPASLSHITIGDDQSSQIIRYGDTSHYRRERSA